MTEAILSFTVLMLTGASLLTGMALREMGKHVDILSGALEATTRSVEELCRALAEAEKGTVRYRVHTGGGESRANRAN